MKSLLQICLLLTASLLSTAAFAALKASVDSEQVATGETVELTLSYAGKGDSLPDLAPLDRDFDVLSTSRSNTVRFINGDASVETQLRLTLAPKRSGELTIPSLTWANERSTPLRVTVGGQRADAPQAQSNVLLKATVDDARPYVQGAVSLTVRLYASVPLYRASLQLPSSSDVLVQQLGKDRNSETEIDGRRYDVVERQYLLFPQHSGALELPGPVLDAQVPARARERRSGDPFSGFFDQSLLGDLMQTTKPLRIRADDIVLDVRPRPASATASYWIPAKNFAASGEWHPDTLEVHVGEPVTLDVHFVAEGLTAAQLPDVAGLLQLPAGIKAYPDQAKLDNSTARGTVVGRRDQSVALIASQPGTFTLSPIRIQWWDTAADELREAELPARTLTVLPALSGAPGPAEVVPNGGSQSASTPSVSPPASTTAAAPWQWVSLALALLWVATMLAWWRSRRRAPTAPVAARPASTKPSESHARERFLTACKLNDAGTARRALLEWTQAKWPEAPPAGLRALSQRIGDSNIDPLLVELDRACFAGGEWHGSVLAQALQQLPEVQRPKADRAALAELYP